MTHFPAADMKPAVPYLGFDDRGAPFLQGSRCGSCGATFVGERKNCASCAAIDAVKPLKLGGTGRLYNYTVVHRSYPGVAVPFISAIVDLDDGCAIKGNLIDIDSASPDLVFDLPVEVVFRGAEIANSAAAGFISHFFVPARERTA